MWKSRTYSDFYSNIRSKQVQLFAFWQEFCFGKTHGKTQFQNIQKTSIWRSLHLTLHFSCFKSLFVLLFVSFKTSPKLLVLISFSSSLELDFVLLISNDCILLHAKFVTILQNLSSEILTLSIKWAMYSSNQVCWSLKKEAQSIVTALACQTPNRIFWTAGTSRKRDVSVMNLFTNTWRIRHIEKSDLASNVNHVWFGSTQIEEKFQT